MTMVEGLFLQLVLEFIIGVSLVLLIVKYCFVKNEPLSMPKGSTGWPLIGETLAYLKPHTSNSMGSFLEQHCSRYGKVFKSNLFGCPTIVSCDHEFNTFVLHNEGRLFQSSYPKAIHDILGKYCMMLVTGDLHKKLRSVAVNFISTSRSNPEFLHYIEDLSSSMMESWKDRTQIGFFKEAKKFTMYVMLKFVLNIKPEDELAPKILEDFLTFMKGFVSIPLYVPGTPYAKAVKARGRLSNTIAEMIKKRRKENDLGMEKHDLLDDMLRKENLRDEERVSITIDLLLAGYETTSGLLGLLVYFIAQAPLSILDELKGEHLVLRRRKGDGEHLSLEDFNQMKFTSNVISEALRCGNLVKFLHREALQDIKFKEYVIPAGWKVLPVLTGAHMDRSLHENPSEFVPSRWLDPTMNKKISPFGGGSRLCPGTDLARVEASFFLHHLVLNYRWRTKGFDPPVSYPYLDFKGGLQLEIEPTKGTRST